MKSPNVTDELHQRLKDAKLENKHLMAVINDMKNEMDAIKQQGRDSSDRAGNAQVHLDHALTQLAVLKRDMVMLKPDYDVNALGDMRSVFYHERTSDQLAKIYMQVDSPEAWQLIKDNPAKVVRNLMDRTVGLTAELETGLANFSAGDGIALLQVMGKSAADILHREG